MSRNREREWNCVYLLELSKNDSTETTTNILRMLANLTRGCYKIYTKEWNIFKDMILTKSQETFHGNISMERLRSQGKKKNFEYFFM